MGSGSALINDQSRNVINAAEKNWRPTQAKWVPLVPSWVPLVTPFPGVGGQADRSSGGQERGVPLVPPFPRVDGQADRSGVVKGGGTPCTPFSWGRGSSGPQREGGGGGRLQIELTNGDDRSIVFASVCTQKGKQFLSIEYQL